MKLHEQIIEALKNTSSESPLTSSEVLSKLDEPTLDAYQNALDQLYNERRINRCTIFKNGIESCLYWLTASGLKTTPYGMFQINPNKSIQAPRRDEIKQIKQEVSVMQPETTKSMAEVIRSLIIEHPGITHQNLIGAVTGYTKEPKAIKKAEDMVVYTIMKKDGFTRHNDIHVDGQKVTKTYYSNADYEKFKQNNLSAVKNDIPTMAQINAINLTALSEPIPVPADMPKQLILDEDKGKYTKAFGPVFDEIFNGIADKKSPLDIQEGGDHYKRMKIQPVQYIMANEIGFVEGSIIKYISRYKNKNGIEDLRKARHFLDILIEQQSH